MTMLTVCTLVCTILAVAGSAVPPEVKASSNETAKTHLVKRSLGCDHGWSGYEHRCFRYIPKDMSWAKAEKNCISLGGHLASVHNYMEYYELQNLVRAGAHEQKESWIGGSDAQEDSYWFWSDGTTFHFTNWCLGEPNNFSGPQQCLKINHGGEKCWDDLACTHERPSLCAKNKE